MDAPLTLATLLHAPLKRLHEAVDFLHAVIAMRTDADAAGALVDDQTFGAAAAFLTDWWSGWATTRRKPRSFLSRSASSWSSKSFRTLATLRSGRFWDWPCASSVRSTPASCCAACAR